MVFYTFKLKIQIRIQTGFSMSILHIYCIVIVWTETIIFIIMLVMKLISLEFSSYFFNFTYCPNKLHLNVKLCEESNEGLSHACSYVGVIAGVTHISEE